MPRAMTLVSPEGAKYSTQVEGSAISGITDSLFVVTRGKAEYVDTDTSRFADTAVRVCSCSLLTASIFSVKEEARSAAKRENGGRGFGSLRRGKVQNSHQREFKNDWTKKM